MSLLASSLSVLLADLDGRARIGCDRSNLQWDSTAGGLHGAVKNSLLVLLDIFLFLLDIVLHGRVLVDVSEQRAALLLASLALHVGVFLLFVVILLLLLPEMKHKQ